MFQAANRFHPPCRRDVCCLLWTAAFLLSLPCSGMDAEVARGLSLYRQGDYDAAVEAFRQAESSGARDGLDQALYTLATIHESRGQSAEAAAVLRRLVEEAPNSPWAANAWSRLADHAVAARDWPRAASCTVRLLELHLAQDHATVDDRVCRRGFERLVEAERQHRPAAERAVAMQTLLERHAADTPAGRVVRYWLPADPADPEANLVSNPGFDLDARDIGTPVGWTVLGTEPNIEDDFDGALSDGFGGVVQARSGGFCGGKFTMWGTHRGWLVQQVPVRPERTYAASVYGFTPATAGNPGRLRLGVDPRGGTDPEAAGVRWTESLSATDSYRLLALDGASAIRPEGSRITLFLELRQEITVPPNAMLFDDASVRPAP